jgi:hypothetical protein
MKFVDPRQNFKIKRKPYKEKCQCSFYQNKIYIIKSNISLKNKNQNIVRGCNIK